MIKKNIEERNEELKKKLGIYDYEDGIKEEELEKIEEFKESVVDANE